MADTGPDQQPAISDTPDTAPAGPVIHVGCADLPPGLRRARYFERLTYLEVNGTLYQLPRPSILQRWASETGERGRFGLVAPQVITHKPARKGYPRGGESLTADQLALAGSFRATDVVTRAVAELASAAAAINAAAVLFRSPPEFSPSSSNRHAMQRFFTEIATEQQFPHSIRVWEPGGLWEPEAAARVAGDLGLVYACDPLSNDPLGVPPEFFASLPSDIAYFRITGLGRAQRRFDEYAMEQLLDIAASYREVWIVFGHADRYPDAIRLHRSLTA